ncbi:hypothetical protein ACKI2C_47485, partial [Streptomyces brasiliscabiei]
MGIKITNLELPKSKLESEYQVVSVARWQKDGEILGWSYERILTKVRYEKISVKVATTAEAPIISNDKSAQQGVTMIIFENLAIRPWAQVDGQFINCGLSATADSAKLVNKKGGNI